MSGYEVDFWCGGHEFHLTSYCSAYPLEASLKQGLPLLISVPSRSTASMQTLVDKRIHNLS